ncbi:MAG TPA: T9SS type A sorting domain-containing protein, partial [Flavobacteriales bacterium]|nr:T9SS type A sorting domain-containing protein [Flavobacteriales bacterium]
GSHNWSNNAENNSDENTIIIHDHTIANIYLQEFTKRFNELGSSNIMDLINIEMDIFPNPSTGEVTIRSDVEIEEINLYDVRGKLLSSTYETNFKINSNGIFFLKIVTEKGNTIRKIVVE